MEGSSIREEGDDVYLRDVSVLDVHWFNASIEAQFEMFDERSMRFWRWIGGVSVGRGVMRLRGVWDISNVSNLSL